MILIPKVFLRPLSLGRTRKFIPLNKGANRGVSMVPLPRIFDMFQYFGTILSTLEILSYSLQDGVNVMGCGELLEACDVTNNDRHLGFYKELGIR